jgi:hypothetical protein
LCHLGELPTMLSLHLSVFMPFRKVTGGGETIVHISWICPRHTTESTGVFLQRVMEKLGFHSKFVQWVMTCVSSVHYGVRFNGTALSPFCPSQGLWQGDLLLPYLFLLVADYLSVLMKHYESQGLISGMKVSRRAPSISHLLFSDDSLLFFKLDDG